MAINEFKTESVSGLAQIKKSLAAIWVSDSTRLVLRLAAYCLMLIWALSFIGTSEAYASFYVICLIAGCFGLSRRKDNNCFNNRSVKTRTVLVAFSLSFALASLLANYESMHGLLRTIVLFVGGTIVAANALYFLEFTYIQVGEYAREKEQSPIPNFVGLLAPFFTLVLVYLACLFAFQYPGNLSSDSIDQVHQAMSQVFSNHHPYWHTVVVGWYVRAFTALFGDINAGVASYCALQSIFMAACISYATFTMRQLGLRWWCIALVTVCFAIMPYHIMYSVTLWKSIPFSCCVLGFSLSSFRIVSSNINNKKLAGIPLDCVLFLFFGMGVALLQHNGWYALLGATICFAVLLGRKHLKLLITCLAILIIAFVLQHPVLNALGVSPIAERESISIPAQQIARVVVDEEIDDDAKNSLQHFIDVGSIRELYDPRLADPIKWSINEDYFREHKNEFFEVWLHLGGKYPGSFTKAWIDQTKGYWFGGYSYWIVFNGVNENDLGIRSSNDSDSGKAFFAHQDKLLSSILFQPFISIGLVFWLVVAILSRSLICGNKPCATFSIPALMVIATLFISAPVFCEFRYAYSLFLVLPPLFFIAMINNDAKG